MEKRRTLEQEYVYRKLSVSELAEDLCVRLKDSDGNSEFLFVESITETEVVFANRILVDSDSYEVTLNRVNDELRDAKGRLVTCEGNIKK